MEATAQPESLSNEQLEQRATDLRNNGRVEAAVQAYQLLRGRFETSGEAQRAAAMQHMIGVTHKVGNHTHESLAALADARQRYEAMGNQVGVGRVLRDEGITHQYAGDFAEAKPLLERSVAVLEQKDAPAELGISEAKLGYWHQETGAYDEAKKWMQRGLETLLKTDQWFYTATTYLHLAGLAHAMHQEAEALTLLEKSKHLFTERNAEKAHQRRFAQLYLLRADVLRAQGEAAASEQAQAKAEEYLAQLDEASANYLRQKERPA